MPVYSTVGENVFCIAAVGIGAVGNFATAKASTGASVSVCSLDDDLTWDELEAKALSSARLDVIAEYLRTTGQASAE